jgi:hypothetical protein
MLKPSIRTRTAVLLAFSAFTAAFLIFLFFYLKNQFFETRTTLSEDVMVEKITSMGKLELVKYSMKDVLERKEIRRFLPDQRILFVAAGEVAGCIDLTRVKRSDISSTTDSVIIFLPQPEICYARLDHQHSRVYDVSGAWFPSDAKTMVEDIYKIAERRILENAKEMNILGKTRENALTIFKPLLENISGKKVGIQFR